MRPRFFLLLTVFWLGQMLVVPHCRADIQGPNKKDKGPSGAPAIGPLTVHAVRGQPVEIRLEGKTRRGAITFSIASPPGLGTLTNPVQKGNLISTVTYTASPDFKGDMDVFTYKAQATDTPTSEPEKVTIRITDSAPKLEVQEVAEAGRVVMGHPKGVILKIRNAGNAAWERKVTPPKGWRWVKPAEGSFNLAPGISTDAEIQCEALSPVTLDETITLFGEKKVRFKALIVAPFTAPSQITLKWNGETRMRTGGIEIQNLDREAPVTVKATGPDWLKFPVELNLEADSKAGLAVSISGDFKRSFSGVIKLVSGTSVQEVQVKANPSPALLRVISGATEDGKVAFGRLDAESIKKASREIVLLNEGGLAARVMLGELKAFRLESPPPANGLAIAPGDEARLVILPPIDIAGTNRELFLLTDGESKIDLELTADIPDTAIAATPGAIAGHDLINEPRRVTGPGPAAPKSKSEVMRNAIMNLQGVVVSDGTEDRTLPVVNIVEPEIQGSDSVTFSWDLPPGEGWKFQLCYSAVRQRNGGGVIKVRVPCGDEVKYSINGRRASATVTGMLPYRWYKYSVQTIAPDGRCSLPGKEFGFQLSAPAPTHWQEYWEWYVGGLVGVTALGYWLRKKWKEPISAVAA